jgi:hypothetical protein
MCGAILPLPNMPSWHGAQLKKKYRDNFNFTFTVFYTNELALGSCMLRVGTRLSLHRSSRCSDDSHPQTKARTSGGILVCYLKELL